MKACTNVVIILVVSHGHRLAVMSALQTEYLVKVSKVYFKGEWGIGQYEGFLGSVIKCQ